MTSHFSIPYLSWAAFLFALALWGGVGFFAWTISAEESARDARVVNVEEEAVRQSAELRIRALARETKLARTQLGEIAHKDIIEILESIEGVGRDAGIPITIGQALSASSDPESSLRTLSFVVEAEGTFVQVTRAIALLESLPIPSGVYELQLEQLPESERAGKGRARLWRTVARIQVLTSADIPL